MEVLGDETIVQILEKELLRKSQRILDCAEELPMTPEAYVQRDIDSEKEKREVRDKTEANGSPEEKIQQIIQARARLKT